MIVLSTRFVIGISVIAVTALIVAMAQMIAFDTHFVELDTSKMIHTSDRNYAICHHGFPSNWRSVSVNGDELTIATRDGQSIFKRMGLLTPEERTSLEAIRNTLNSVIRLGPFNIKSQTKLCKLTTYDRNGGSSSMGSGGAASSSSSTSSSSSSSSSSGGTSISRTGPNAFIISKQDFPYNWQRLFVNEDVITVVYRDGRVVMLPQSIMRPEERAKVNEIRAEVDKSARATENLAKSFSKSFSNPMEFVNRALGGIFGR